LPLVVPALIMSTPFPISQELLSMSDLNPEVLLRRSILEGVLLALSEILSVIPQRCDITIHGLTERAIRCLDQEIDATDCAMRRCGLRAVKDVIKDARP